MLNALFALSRHPLYWLAILAIGLAMEGIALYYQYQLDYGPCILCSHVRAWVMAIVITSIPGLFFRNRALANGAIHVVLLGWVGGLSWTSWQTLAIERGWILGSCEFSNGYPDWFPLHAWWPAVFEPWELCGYTPELWFGITMAEALVAVAFTTAAFLLAMLAALLKNRDLGQA